MHRNLSREAKDYVLERDRFTCAYCGAPAADVDHVQPVSKGGLDHPHNLVAVCNPCNQKKKARLNLEELTRGFFVAMGGATTEQPHALPKESRPESARGRRKTQPAPKSPKSVGGREGASESPNTRKDRPGLRSNARPAVRAKSPRPNRRPVVTRPCRWCGEPCEPAFCSGEHRKLFWATPERERVSTDRNKTKYQLSPEHQSWLREELSWYQRMIPRYRKSLNFKGKHTDNILAEISYCEERVASLGRAIV